MSRTFFPVLFFFLTPWLAWSQPGPLPDTQLLTMEGDLSFTMQEKVDAFLMHLTEESPESREGLWQRDYSSPESYNASIAENRERFKRYIGLADKRIQPSDLALVSSMNMSALVAESEDVRIYAVRWPVLEGVEGEGLLLEPRGDVVAQVVVLPDADSTPEVIVGLAGQDPAQSMMAFRLALAGCRVLVPTLINRDFQFSGNPRVRPSNQTHREFVYRQAYFMGRHIIGFEVQKVQSALDYFQNRSDSGHLPIGVAGYGEGGLTAFYAAAADPRVQAVLVSGYFNKREELWKEPVYRNVWGLLHEFGDAGVASLIAPRNLVVEASLAPEVPGPPPPRNGINHAAPGVLTTPELVSVESEFARARTHYERLGLAESIQLIVSEEGRGSAGSAAALQAFGGYLGINTVPDNVSGLTDQRPNFDPTDRQRRQVQQLVDFCQKLMYLNPHIRAEFWNDADDSSLEAWKESTRRHREYFWKEIVGWLPPPTLPPGARTRIVYETPKWKGYEVVLDVYPEVIAYGILLVPNGIQAGERRPVVVAQHGRAGRPQDVCNPNEDTRAYHSFGARLADLGFVVFAPQNLYIGEEIYRTLQRKANPLKQTFFGVMVRQHEQILNWLSELPFVDPQRIGFYGLSYGGKSAMFIPAILEGYALSICSGDFNEEVWKHVSIQQPFSFVLTNEHEHTEFDFGSKFNYAELAGLIAPRPFMVERGHHDGVAIDEWVAYEYAKVRRRYVELGIGDRTEIEYFLGPHEINGQGTFLFLQKHLNWSQGKEGTLW
ncbi:MAG TPA: dienelactone hydrolase family protein [Acidobacteriota bacterium]|nr:dienelactone hydrolase family protein [Acidobacteriota bacterium]